MYQSLDRNSVLIYLNPKKRKFAIVCDEKLEAVTGARYWKNIQKYFARDLRSTHSDNAIRLLIETLGVTLGQHFKRRIG